MKSYGEFVDEFGNTVVVESSSGDEESLITVKENLSNDWMRVSLNRKQCFELALSLVQSAGADRDGNTADSIAAYWLENSVEFEAEKEKDEAEENKIKKFIMKVLGLGDNARVTEADQNLYARALKWRDKVDSDILTYENAESADKSVVWASKTGAEEGFMVQFNKMKNSWEWKNDRFPVWETYKGSHLGMLASIYFPMKRLSE